MTEVILYTAVILISLPVKMVIAETMTDVTSLYTDLLSGYDVRVRPTAIDQQHATNVTLTFSLNYIQDVNVKTGEFAVLGSITTQWNDPRMAWTPSMRGGAFSLILPRHSVWTPEFTVINRFDSPVHLDSSKYDVLFVYDGTAVWKFDIKLRAVCNYDISDYPFDVQTCAIELSPLGLTSSQLRLITTTSAVDVTDLVKNNAWDYMTSSVTVIDKASRVYVNVEIEFARINGLYELIMYSPFVMVFILNFFVFSLPVDSGERVGFALVCLLCLIIFSKSVVVQFQTNIYPVPKISIFIVVVLFLSSSICVLTVLHKCYNIRYKTERKSTYLEHVWKYDNTKEEKNTKVRVSPSAIGSKLLKCEETREI